MAIGSLFNVPSTENELNEWSFAHMAMHIDVNKQIQTLNGPGVTSYVLDPVSPKDTGAWIYQHQNWHNQVNSIIKTQGYDLTGLDWTDNKSLPGWIQLHATEHYMWSDALRVSVPVVPTVTINSTFNGHGETTLTTSTYTFASVPFGAAAASRAVLIGVSWQTASGATISSATVAGISATTIVQSGPSPGNRFCGIIIAPVPTGTNGTVVINFTSNCINCTYASYGITGLSSLAASSAVTSTAINPTATISVNARGSVVAIVCGGSSSPPSTSWSGLTSDCSNNYGLGSLQVRSSAHMNFSSAQTSYAITCTISPSVGSTGCFCVFNP